MGLVFLKTVTLLSVFLFGVATLAGCAGESELTGGETVTREETVTASGEESIPDYRTISCRQVAEKEWSAVKLIDHATSVQVQMSLPSDWVLEKKDERSCRILRNGLEIGGVSLEEMPADDETFSVKTEYGKNNIRLQRQIAWRRDTEAGNFYRTLSITHRQDGAKLEGFLWVSYDQMDDAAWEQLASSAEPLSRERELPSLTEGNGSKEILVLGNSFINTSKIGAFLEDMIASGQGGIQVNAVSIGMANITTFAERANLCSDMQRGRYSHVFLCGFYSDDVLEDLGLIRSLCSISRTTLVAFPAHNESASTINNALSQYKTLAFLDWKGQIDAFLEAGVPDDDLYYNDSHKHSTPLAGYVGAYMIYEALFDKTPPEITGLSPISAAEKNAKLGQYLHLLEATSAFEGAVLELNG